MTKLHTERGLDGGPHNGPRLLLGDHHRRIEKTYQAIMSSTYADDSRELVDEFRRFETAILEHIAAEEETLRRVAEDEQVLGLTEEIRDRTGGDPAGEVNREEHSPRRKEHVSFVRSRGVPDK